MDLLRVYLFAGLLLHKAVWEFMKRQGPQPSAPKGAQSLKVTLVKSVKVAILVGIMVQTALPDLLPLSPERSSLRMGGALLYTLGLAIALLGRIQLGGNWLDIETAGVKREQSVVDRGVYRYVRHPIYTGDLLMLFGLELALNSWLLLFIAALTPIVLRQAVQEEEMLVRSLPGYDLYRQRTKRFIPFVA